MMHPNGKTSNQDGERVDAVVVGAGFSGLYALYRLRDKLGLNVRVFEAGGGVGGTWFWNRYPGCRCDVPSYLYSFAFSEELDQEWSWSEKYAAQPEIERYLNHVADRFDLRRDIRFNARVSAAAYREPEGVWDIETSDGYRATARFLVSAVGILSEPYVPELRGQDSFRGRLLSTSRWPDGKVDFNGRRVGIIGTGSTGIQVIPVVAEEAKHLTVFQRSANYAIPARNAPTDPAEERRIKENYRDIRRKERSSPLGYPQDPPVKSALEVSSEEREQVYERCWREGGFGLLFESFKDIVSSRGANDTVARFFAAKIRQRVRDPALATLLTPTHPFGARRPALETGYYEAFSRDNVTLVDLRSNPIEELTPQGIRAGGTHYALDDLILATGFDALTGSLVRMRIRGRNGIALEEHWRAGARTCLGMASHGFPNLFMITGPQGGVQYNVARNIEQNVDWIAACIAFMRERSYDTFEVDDEAEAWWNEQVDEAAAATLVLEASSWWTGTNIPGKPRAVLRYVGGRLQYQEACAEIAASGYRGFSFTRAPATTGHDERAPRTRLA